ncbi:MAG: radical SAM protein [Patescibacteria group bacterium]
MDVIWNLTRVCPWNCRICCVSAVYATGKTKHKVVTAQKESGKELSLAEKLTVLRLLVDRNFEIDFSGGDPLYYEEDFFVVEQATQWLPSKKIGISMTGSEITEAKINLLRKVGVVEFTLDNLPKTKNPFRPNDFNVASMKAMRKCVANGIRVRAITVLYSKTMPERNLIDLYSWLCKNNVSEWELLRYYPIGRGRNLAKNLPSKEKYLEVMRFLRSLHGSTRVFFQHSLNLLEKDISCPAVTNSFGILPDGTVVACAWALDRNCFPLSEFYLGKLPEEDIDSIIARAQQKPMYCKTANFCRTMVELEKGEK